MLKLYYTISSGVDDPQTNPSNSIGGFRSGTPVINDDLNNLFDEISMMTIKQDKPQYIGIILKNESDASANVNLWFGSQPKQGIFEIAAVLLNQNSEGQYVMERIDNMYSRPMYAEFSSPTESEKASIGEIKPSQEIGIWIKRSINIDEAKNEYNNVAEKDPNTRSRYRPVVQETEESIDLIFEY